MKKVFIVQMTRMGDIVQTLPLIKRLKEQEESCEVTVMCVMEPMELIRRSPLIDRMLYLPFNYYRDMMDQSEIASAKLESLFENMKELQEEYDLVVNLTHNVVSAVICERLQSLKKSGRIHTQKGKLRSAGDWGKYLFAVVANRAQNSFNLVDISIAMGDIPHKPVYDYFSVEEGETLRAQQVLRKHGYKGKGTLVGLQMGASELHRAWPVKYFASLAGHLMEQADIEVVLLGIPKEKELGEEFVRLARLPVINLIGETKANGLPGILKLCNILVSNDTGTAHIAAAVGTRVLGLYFSTAYYAETGPYGKDHVILQVELPCSPCLGDTKCEGIECKDYLHLEAVEKAADMMLNGGKTPPFNYPCLSVYRSEFLSNGTMAYSPLSSTITSQYQTGFINRILWEEVLGLEHDFEYIQQYLPAMKCMDQYQVRIESYQREHKYLSELFQKAIILANDVKFELHRPTPDNDKILNKNDELAEIQSLILNSTDSLMKAFHHYELMDLDYASYSDIARQIIAKYIKLQGMADSFLMNLRKLYV